MGTLESKVVERMLGGKSKVDRLVKEGKLTVLGNSRPRKFESSQVYKLERETRNNYKFILRVTKRK